MHRSSTRTPGAPPAWSLRAQAQQALARRLRARRGSRPDADRAFGAGRERARSARQAHVDPGCSILPYCGSSISSTICEPRAWGCSNHSALVRHTAPSLPALRHEVLPFLRRARLEELARPLQVCGEQMRVAHDTLDVSEPFLVPVGDAGSRDELTEVLISGAPKLHPSTVRTFKATAPDAARCGNDMGRVVHAAWHGRRSMETWHRTRALQCAARRRRADARIRAMTMLTTA